MAKVKIQGNASGTGILTVTAPNTSTDRTITLPDGDVTLGAATPSIDDNGNATAITIDANENVGIRVTPETILSTYPTLQIGYGGAIAANTTNPSRFSIAANSYINASGNRAYIQTDEATELWMNGGTYEFRVAASGTADADITWTTGFEVLNDGKARAKNGLLFGTDTAAANTLDDYEEGTWTPTVNGGSWTLTIQKATYTKVGNLVTLLIYIEIGTGSGDGTRFEIGGMPFDTLSNGYGQGSADTNTLGHVGLRTQSDASYMIVKKANNNPWVNENEIDGGHLIGALIYHVA
jgi:hypothetical protein